VRTIVELPLTPFVPARVNPVLLRHSFSKALKWRFCA
jgi:hypothetical protein